ncbi:FAD-dependent oxidoreductase [Nocardia amikacinitolerans]|uniref:FAD-dependent oxidoreductase n=1 Tax=Nocardia amikacinitolerans TaxID=756689 RepID=UPI0020A57DCE|nr:FAD-dependent oxidoreductase [Nocardia amikacinitolerans]MCP2278358.1 Pyridine nucleotide-disulfide oxidoreductase [Nocardia amikacinitolerans]
MRPIPRCRAYLNRVLDRLGVVRTVGVKVAKVLPDAVRLDTGALVPSDLILWTTGVRVSPLAAQAGIATDARGLIITDATLRSVSHPEIHAIGDAALVRQAWGQLHGTCQSGVVTADHTAAVVYKEQVSGTPPMAAKLSRYVKLPVQLSKGGRATRKTA